MSVRLFFLGRRKVGAMPRWGHGDKIRADEIPVRLHDVATGLAIGISLLKGEPGGRGKDTARGDLPALALLEDSLAQLRTLTAATTGDSGWRRPRSRLVESILREASRLRIRLELETSGKEDWLAPNLADLILIVSREALRNVRRHASASDCKITIDLASCPFSVRIRDWGAGLFEGARSGGGIELLQRMAADMGCELGVSSQPGLGTDLVLVGPVCARDRAVSPAEVSSTAYSNSKVADLTAEHAEHTAHGGQNSRIGSRLKR